ncbi:DinB family protein [Microlunatus sp. Y2014]|uniref:DinB family protein n=1 Tax=Microlunatus sp. Y2014 TaxID=3418488 RepID=UPI003DA7243A
MSTAAADVVTATTTIPADLDPERVVLLETLRKHRTLLRYTVRGLSEEDARRRTTASTLTLASILKHVLEVEEGWVDFLRTGVVVGADRWRTDEHAEDANADTAESSADAESGTDDADDAEVPDDFALTDADTVEHLLARYEEVAARTDDLVATGDLDVSHPLPPAPWFPEGARWSARHVYAHIIGETAHHSGHADIIRETLDGQRSMG